MTQMGCLIAAHLGKHGVVLAADAIELVVFRLAVADYDKAIGTSAPADLLEAIFEFLPTIYGTLLVSPNPPNFLAVKGVRAPKTMAEESLVRGQTRRKLHHRHEVAARSDCMPLEVLSEFLRKVLTNDLQPEWALTQAETEKLIGVDRCRSMFAGKDKLPQSSRDDIGKRPWGSAGALGTHNRRVAASKATA